MTELVLVMLRVIGMAAGAEGIHVDGLLDQRHAEIRDKMQRGALKWDGGKNTEQLHDL